MHRAALIVMYGASMVYRLNTDVGSVSWMIWSARGVVCDGISSTLYISLRYVLPLLKFFTITDLRVGVDRYLLSARHSSRTGTSYPVKPRLLPCALPERAHEHFVVLHTNGLHPVTVNYCNCTRAIPHHLQLLRRGWYPSTPKRPRTAATFRYLEHLEIISLTSKVGVYDCWRACEKLTDNSGRRNIKVSCLRYVNLLRY